MKALATRRHFAPTAARWAAASGSLHVAVAGLDRRAPGAAAPFWPSMAKRFVLQARTPMHVTHRWAPVTLRTVQERSHGLTLRVIHSKERVPQVASSRDSKEAAPSAAFFRPALLHRSGAVPAGEGVVAGFGPAGVHPRTSFDTVRRREPDAGRHDSVGGGSWSVAPAVARVVAARSRSGAPDTTLRGVPDEVLPGRARLSTPAPQRAAPAALDSVEVDRVAQQVMRSLDRRVSAWRERQGRV